MSITVNELNNFSTENYKGIPVNYNAEDLSFIAKQGEQATDNEYYDPETNFRFVYIRDNRLLAIDESNLIAKRLAANYRISLATPPLVNFAFDLAFVRKATIPAPAAVTLMTALRAIGYGGPEVVNLAQANMYLLTIEPAVPAYMKVYASGTPQTVASLIWANVFSTLS